MYIERRTTRDLDSNSVNHGSSGPLQKKNLASRKSFAECVSVPPFFTQAFLSDEWTDGLKHANEENIISKSKGYVRLI